MDGSLPRIEEGRNAFKILTAKPTREMASRKTQVQMEEQYQNKFKGIDNNMRNLIDWTRDRHYWRGLVNDLTAKGLQEDLGVDGRAISE